MQQSRVFLSYSRQDTVFVERLYASLKDRGYHPDYDRNTSDPVNEQSGISAQDSWWRRIEQLISASDAMVFLVSPDSARSKVCDLEIAFAHSLSKRVIPIKIREVDFSQVPPLLAKKNVKIDFTDARLGFELALDELCANLDVDVAWRRRGIALQAKAVEWSQSNKNSSFLLNEGAVQDASDWRASRPNSEPTIGPLLAEYFDASRAQLRDERNRMRSLIQRSFVQPLLTAKQKGDTFRLTRTIGAAAVLSADKQLSLEAGISEPHRCAVLRAAGPTVFQRPMTVFWSSAGPVRYSFYSQDGSRIYTISDDDTLRAWDPQTSKEISYCNAKKEGARISCASLLPDGFSFLIGYCDGQVSLWDFENKTEKFRISAHSEQVNNVELSPSGEELLTAADDYRVRIWSFYSGKMISELHEHTNRLRVAIFSLSGNRVLTSCFDGITKVWKPKTGKIIVTLKRHIATAFSPDEGSILTIPKGKGSPAIWKLSGGPAVAKLTGHNDSVSTAVFSVDGSRVLTSSWDETARIWDAVSGEEVGVLSGHEGAVQSAVFSHDGHRILTSSLDKTARTWDARDGQELAIFRGHEDHITAAMFSPDDVSVLTSSLDRTAIRWGSEADPEIASFLEHKLKDRVNSVTGLALAETTGQVWSIAQDGLARRWCLETGEETASLKIAQDEEGTFSLASSSDGMTIAIGTGKGRLKVVNLHTNSDILERSVHSEHISCISFSSCQKRILTGSFDKSARLFDIQRCEAITSFEGHGEIVRQVAFSACGQRVLTASDDGTTKLWDAAFGVEMHSMKTGYNSTDLSFSEDGKLAFFVSSRGKITIWDLEKMTDSPVYSFQIPVDDINLAVFSPEKRRVFVNSGLTNMVLDLATGMSLASFSGHTAVVEHAMFTGDGNWLITASVDGTIRVWDVSRSNDVSEDVPLSLSAMLDCGVGLLTQKNREGLLMQDCPVDLFAEMRTGLTDQQLLKLPLVSAKLRSPLHPNCYLSPTARNER